MDTCENNQKLYQWALNIPDINIQQLPMIKYICLFELQKYHFCNPFFCTSQIGAIMNVK